MSQKITVHEIQQGKVALGDIEIAGWVRTHRRSKNVSFIELSDGSCQRGLQLVIAPDLEPYLQVADAITTGSSITVRGALQESPAKGQSHECHVQEITLLGSADALTYPLQKKGHTLEFLREIQHLRFRSNTFGAVNRIRSRAAYAIHNFFQERSFVYMHAPIISTSDCEGAGSMFQVTTLDLNEPPKVDGKPNYSEDFFKQKSFLTVSGQLEAECAALALGKVYTFGPTFRAENSNTTRHLAEFWMIEPEVAFNDLFANVELADGLIRWVIRDLLTHCAEDLAFLHAREWAPKGLGETLQGVLDQPIQYVEYTDAVKILEGAKCKFEFPVFWGMDLQAEHERFLTDQHFKGPVAVINYPKQIKAFYMRNNDDGKTVAAMDILAPQLGEIVGGSQREERLDLLLARIHEMQLPEEEYWWYLDLRRFGSVPHAGFGLGFERILMYVTGMQNIRDVIPFPRFPGHAKF